MSAGWLRSEASGDRLVLRAGGDWDVANATALDALLRQLSPQGMRRISLDLGEVERFDTAGAWLAHRVMKRFRAAGCDADVAGLRPDLQAMLDQVAASDRPAEAEPPGLNPFLAVVLHVGEGAHEAAREAMQQLAFLGLLLVTIGRTIRRPRRLRFTPLVYHMEKVGLNALPIVGLISFLIGVVLAYQGATQLQKFGAEVFVVDLIAVSVLREIGILLTAIVIAGRSGSAFTAEIGSMMVHEEVDAMRTLGLDPMEVLVLPRVLALVLTLPLLAFFADMMGLLGGLLMSWGALDISPGLYLERLNNAVSMWSFWVGIIKAPFFAFLIAMVGCLEGLRVERSAESVGRQTTRAVVTAIFLVIIVDALFSIFFATVGV
jgi:phospholipid/cholesterol/gamma-HCH transport system permease protein